MPDWTDKLLPDLLSYRLDGLEMGEEFVYPHYTGRSLLNLPASVCGLLGAPPLGARPLDAELLDPLRDGVRQVLLVLIDGLGLGRLRRYLDEGLAPVWKELLPEGLLAPLTSITPSTTAAALTTLWSGRSPAEHGVIAYELWLKEYGVTANMILHAPISYNGDVGGLSRAGFDPTSFLPVKTLGPHLGAHGVRSYAFMHRAIAASGLSAMHLAGVKTYGYRSPADLWVSLRDWSAAHEGERAYAYAYWSDLDELAHRFGPDDERIGVEFDAFSHTFEKTFLAARRGRPQKDTLLIVTADHGLIYTPHEAHNDLRNHPRLVQMLHILPTGEHRLPILYIRPGYEEAVREYVQASWPGQFFMLTPSQAVEAGLLGPGSVYPRVWERLGDLILAPRGNAYWWWADKENSMLGRHGGLSPQEMLIPLLAVRV